MNRYSAFPRKLPSGGYWAMLRLCRDAHPAPVMGSGDKPKVFPTKGEAVEECLRHIMAFINGRPIRGESFNAAGTTKEAARIAADRIFMGGGKTVQVERIQARA
jgi:hypothetical protein